MSRALTRSGGRQAVFGFVGDSAPRAFEGLNNGDRNKLFLEDRPAHDWYRFVLSFSPQLVRGLVKRFDLAPDSRVLDPFCGTGTTLVECKKLGIPSCGFEAHPMGAFASRVKTTWDVDSQGLAAHAALVADAAQRALGGAKGQLRTLPPPSAKLLVKNSISPRPLHKILVLLECLREHAAPAYSGHELLALAKALVADIGNLHFGPEVGVGKIKEDARVVESWLSGVHQIAADLEALNALPTAEARVWRHDSRERCAELLDGSLDAVITSPPYPNEKDYTRTTRLETVLLGFVQDRTELRGLKQGLLRSNTRNVFKVDDEDQHVELPPHVEEAAETIEKRRIALGKTSGFERQYARVTRLYFAGMTRHFCQLRTALRPGARLAYVVGDQASYLRVMIRTGRLLAEIAASVGYEVEGLELFRTRLSTATRARLREEILVLRWPG